MAISRRFALAGIAALCLLVGACHRHAGSAGPAAPSAQALARARAATAQPAWLRAHLPANAVAYLRIPSPWTLLGATPTGTALDAAAVDAHQLEVVAQLRKAAAESPQLAGTDIGALIDVYFSRLNSPLEMAMVDATGMTTPNGRMLLTAQLSVTDAAAVQRLFATIPRPSVQLSAPLDRNGDGQLAMGAAVHFDAPNRRLFVLVGAQPVDHADMNALLTGLQPGAKAPASMSRLEPQLDASGQGLFAWIRLDTLARLLGSRLPANLAGSVVPDLAEHVSAIALGSGTVHGHGRISIALDAPKARVLRYLATKLDFSGLDTIGDPDWALSFALPTPDQVHAFESHLDQELGAKGAATWRKWQQQLQAAGIFDVVTLTGVLGPEVVIFDDDSGTYTAVRLRDAKAFHAQLATLATRYHWKIGSGRSGAADVHWFSAPGFGKPGAAPGTTAGDDETAFKLLLQRLRTHAYWVEDGDWLIFGDVPQALADRAAASGRRRAIGGWFARQDYPADTWIGLTAVNRGAQRDAYYRYLRALVMLGDVLDRPVDILPLPGANKLGLPDRGLIGMALTASPDTFALHLDYTQWPGELLQGNGTMTTVAVAGILAAIAIPAYQDYVIRAQVSDSMILAESAKVAVAEYYVTHSHLPRDNAAAGLGPPQSLHGRYVASISVDAGAIHVNFGTPPAYAANARIAGKTVLLTPQPSAQGLQWHCSSDIAAKLLPASCRH